MTDHNNRLQQKLWEIERAQKAKSFSKLLSEKFGENNFEILDFDFADKFMINSENYPENKYERKLFQQIELNNKSEVTKSITSFLKNFINNYGFVFSYNYNFGLTKIKNDEIIKNWEKLIDLDGDEIMIFNSENGKFLSIELTEEFMINYEEKGRIKFYELTESEK